MDTTKNISAFELIREFNEKRNLLLNYNKTQGIYMLDEELKEYTSAETTTHGVKELCDIIIVATGEIEKQGFNTEVALFEVIKQINSREGKLGQNGKWQKNKEQEPSTLYRPNILKALRK